jgi:hypothetical protein
VLFRDSPYRQPLVQASQAYPTIRSEQCGATKEVRHHPPFFPSSSSWRRGPAQTGIIVRAAVIRSECSSLSSLLSRFDGRWTGPRAVGARRGAAHFSDDTTLFDPS